MSENCMYTKKDFTSSQEVKWCPGCGDYAVLSSLQLALTKLNIKKEEVVCVSGIGCSSRFPYYMNTYGYHTIHGRAPAIATGIKVANPELQVWMITGDGDGLSIGGNHLIHILRRNVDLNIMLFNNQIYGLTKGQYSPTSTRGKVTKSSPYGSIDRSFNPCKLAIGAGGTFIARTLDTDPKHMIDLFSKSAGYKGSSFIEIFQNCVIFNNKTHDSYTNKLTREDHTIQLEDGMPMLFGKNKEKGLVFNNFKLEIININNEDDIKKVLIHDSSNEVLANMLIDLTIADDMPIAMGIIYKRDDIVYEEELINQIKHITEDKGIGNMNELLHSGETWTVS